MIGLEAVARAKKYEHIIPAEWFHRLCGLLIGNIFVWLSVFIYRHAGYYSANLYDWTQQSLFYLALSYSLYALVFYFSAPLERVSNTTSRRAFTALWKFAIGLLIFIKAGPKDYTHPFAILGKLEKRALLFGAVKFFFIPIMINFLYGNYTNLISNLHTFGSAQAVFSVVGFNDVIYPLLFALFLLVDTAFFAFGYLFEASFLSNKIRSVEPTFIGWAVALICYPPFNSIVNGYTSWYASDNPVLSSQAWTVVLKLCVLALMGFYAICSVALGPKASNLTNRGIVSYGPYRIVRHPAYISKNLAWWFSLLPVLSLQAVVSMAIWSSIYFMRAITEERHLSADPDYQEYCRQVKRRFIPGVL